MRMMIVYAPETKGSDIAWAFTECGYDVMEYKELIKTYYSDLGKREEVTACLEQTIRSKGIEICFSWNYLSTLSDACELQGIPYVSWHYDSPVLHLFAANMHNRCNYFFVFDRKFYQELKGYHLAHLYYLPLGVNSGQLKKFAFTEEQLKHYRSEVSFVGRLYQDNEFDQWSALLPSHIMQRIEDIFARQFNCWRENIIYQELDNGFLKTFGDCMDMSTVREQFPHISERTVYGGLILARKYAQVERTCILEELAQHFPLVMYTESDTSALPHVENRGSVDYRTQMPIAFCASLINLNFTLKSIESGIPLRVFDIMGSGGFAMSNWQPELEEYFVPDEDLVLYESVEELIDKIHFYLGHEQERLRILKNGYRKVHAEHNYAKRIESMMKMAGL